MPIIRHDIQQLAALGDTYANAAPDLFDFLNNAATTAHTMHAQEKDLDQALLAAAGFGDTGADIFNRGGPYWHAGPPIWCRRPSCWTPTVPSCSAPSATCTTANPRSPRLPVAATAIRCGPRPRYCPGWGWLLSLPGLGLHGRPRRDFSGWPDWSAERRIPYVYPENLPRVNAHGGPGGAPGCWQTITRDLWPAPTLVMDTGNSLAPYNHVDIGSPYAVEYVWGRQMGDHTINP